MWSTTSTPTRPAPWKCTCSAQKFIPNLFSILIIAFGFKLANQWTFHDCILSSLPVNVCVTEWNHSLLTSQRGFLIPTQLFVFGVFLCVCVCVFFSSNFVYKTRDKAVKSSDFVSFNASKSNESKHQPNDRAQFTNGISIYDRIHFEQIRLMF